ncbi:MAG: hypothetical protein H6712_01720 [Myxococcales bacterium]|nr:hypothetical protein [Myxococcales bacterium]
MSGAGPMEPEGAEHSEPFYEDETYRVTVRPGVSDTGIIAFGGIGLALDGIQIEEFGRSLRGEHSVFFVIDKARSWWNHGDVLALLDDVVGAAHDAGICELAAIGNSMGGSGALLAAHCFGEISRCLALVPQADVRMSQTLETRWIPLRERIEIHRFETFALAPRAGEARIVFGARGPDEIQRRLFVEGGLPIDVVEGYDHELASRAKREDPRFYRSLVAFVTEGTPIAWPDRERGPDLSS